MDDKPFAVRTKEEKAATVRKLMAEGHSFRSAAKVLGVKPGVVAGICHRHDIASQHPQPANLVRIKK